VSLDQDVDEMLADALERLPHWKTRTVEFVKSLRDQYEERGSLTEAQLEALERICEELEGQ
jgi:hypothetical protein